MAGRNSETRELIKILNEQNIRFQERQETALNKISEAIMTLNHNSSATLGAIEAFKDNSEKQSGEMIAAIRCLKQDQRRMLEAMRYIAYASIPIVGAVVGIKTVMP